MNVRRAAAARTDLTHRSLVKVKHHKSCCPSRAREPGWCAWLLLSVLLLSVLTVGWLTSQNGFLAHRVFAVSLLLQTEWPEDARMFEGNGLLRKRKREEASDSICQGGSGYGKFRRRIWISQRRTMHRPRCLPKSLPPARIGCRPLDTVRLVCLEDSSRVRSGFVACCCCYENGCACNLRVTRSGVPTVSHVLNAEFGVEPFLSRQKVSLPATARAVGTCRNAMEQGNRQGRQPLSTTRSQTSGCGTWA